MNSDPTISHDIANAQEEKPQESYFSVIPTHILDDHRLDDSTKILFIRLSSLTKKEGYCWASDKYLADLTGCETRELKRRLKTLEDYGYIRRDTKRKPDGLTWDRKIFSNYNYEGSIRTPREGHTDPSGGPYGPHNNIIKQYNNFNTQEGAQSAPARERAPAPMPAAPLPKAKERAQHVSTTDEEHEKLIAKYGQEKTDAYYQHLSEWKEATAKSKWKKGDYKSILRWVVDAYEEQKKRKAKVVESESEEINKKGAIQVAVTLKEKAKLMSCTIDALHDRLEICPIGYSQREPFVIKYTEKGFKEQLHCACRKWGLL